MMGTVLYLAAAVVPPGEGRADFLPWLGEADGKLVIELLFDRLAPLDPARIIVMAQSAELQRSHLGSIVNQLSSRATVVPVYGMTGGAACTAMLAIDRIPLEEELLVLASNEFLDADYLAIIDGFRAKGADAGTVIFSSVHPRYSFARLDEAGQVIQVAQKEPISRHAMAGFHWFRRAGDFLEAVVDMITKDAAVDGVFYVAPAFNEMVLRQKVILVHPVEPQAYRPLKTQRQVESFEAGKRG